MIRVVVVDDHAIVRAGVRMVLEKQPDIQVVGEADNGELGLQLIRSLNPDVALVDLHMPGVNGIEVTEHARRAKVATRIAILTMAADAPLPRRLLEAGASGYLTKGCPAEELVKAIRQIAGGSRYLSADVAQQLALSKDESPFNELSTRELEVAMMLAQGLAPKQIGVSLSLSDKTVSTYKQRVFGKLAIDNVVALAHLATAHGLMDKPRRQV
jgi:DNA-binding NarL/FixJ family response regulator